MCVRMYIRMHVCMYLHVYVYIAYILKTQNETKENQSQRLIVLSVYCCICESNLATCEVVRFPPLLPTNLLRCIASRCKVSFSLALTDQLGIIRTPAVHFCALELLMSLHPLQHLSCFCQSSDLSPWVSELRASNAGFVTDGLWSLPSTT